MKPRVDGRNALVDGRLAADLGLGFVPHALSMPDAKRLLEVIRHERLRAFYVLALTTGLRRVTMNTYTHVLPALRHEAADAIDELFGA